MFDHLLDEYNKSDGAVAEWGDAAAFVRFAREYLQRNPPQLQLMLAGNFGVRLANGVNVALLSEAGMRAANTEMEPAHAIQIGRG
jgi:hypothetical protein